MKLDNALTLLGTYFGEATLQSFLVSVGITEEPEFPKEDTTTFLEKTDIGLELTFTVERYLSAPTSDYPEGALVLTNLRLYGTRTKRFKPFAGTLPFKLEFRKSMEELRQILGAPAWYDPELSKARWDKDGFSVFVKFDDEQRSSVYSFQKQVSE